MAFFAAKKKRRKKKTLHCHKLKDNPRVFSHAQVGNSFQHNTRRIVFIIIIIII